MVKNGISCTGCNDQKISVIPWDALKTRLPTEEDNHKSIERGATKIAAICGAVSGNLLCIDFDLKYHPLGLQMFSSCLQKISDYLGGPEGLLIVETPSGGRHLWFRSDEPNTFTNEKLAGRLTTAKEREKNPKVKLLYFIETRAEGGYALVPPSAGYNLLAGSFTHIPMIKLEQMQDILDICREYTQIVNEESNPTKSESKHYDHMSNLPWDAYNRDSSDSHIQALIEAGWKHVSSSGQRDYYKRPGSENKQSANWHNEKRLFYVFTSNSEFEANQAYTPFSVLCKVKFKGDRKATIQYLIANGYGKSWTPQQKEKIEAVSIALHQGKMFEDVINQLDPKIFNNEQIERVREMTGDRHYIRTQLYFTLVRNAKGAMSVQIMIHRLRDFLMNIQPRINKFWRVARMFDNRYLLIDEKTKIVQSIENYSDIAPLLANLIDDSIAPIIDEDGSNWSELLKEQHEKLSKTVKDAIFSEMPKVEISRDQWLHDGKYNSYIPYSTEVVKVSKDKVTLIPWEENDKYVYKEQILDHAFVIDSALSAGDFGKYFYRIGGLGSDCDEMSLHQIYADPDSLICRKIHPLVMAMGYLLHAYKDPARSYVIVVSEDVDDSAKGGGTGKTLMLKAAGFIRVLHEIAGRTLKPDDQFVFGLVQAIHQIVLIDDIKPNFPFGFLYNATTGNFEVERKRQDRLSLAFEDAPKICVSSNFSLGEDAESNHLTRRLRQIYLSPYFSPTRSPEQEFGRLMFTEWDQNEWNAFHNFMISCIQIYLRSGRVVPGQTGSENALKKSIKTAMKPFGAEFIHFLENKTLKSVWTEYGNRTIFNAEIRPQLEYRDFMAAYDIGSFRDLNAKVFKDCLKQYLRGLGIDYDEILTPLSLRLRESARNVLRDWAMTQTWYQPEEVFEGDDLPF